MKTRTLLLLSVGTALMILMAGGVLLFQLSGQEVASQATPFGEEATVGDARVTVLDTELLRRHDGRLDGDRRGRRPRWHRQFSVGHR